MPVLTLAGKELRLLMRDRRASLLLLALPLLFILILGLLLGESFGQKPDDRLRVSIVDLDRGYQLEEGMGWLAQTPLGGCGAISGSQMSALILAATNQGGRFPHEPWSKLVERDLAETAGIKVEVIENRAEAETLVAEHRRAGILIFEPGFSYSVSRCSFLVDGINPFYRDGVYLDRVNAKFLRDSKQPGGAAIVEQVAQVTLLRVILPWMIGRAFERLSDPEFIDILGKKVNLPVPAGFRILVGGKEKMTLSDLLQVASSKDPRLADEYKQKVGSGVQDSLREQFKKYELTGKTWAALTKSIGERQGQGAEATSYQNQNGLGVLKRGAQRYQLIVPSYTVMFAFFLVMTVGWLFVSERRQGTLKRLRAAPLTRSQILLGKLLPCFLVSISQGIFLLAAGKLVFGMRWGPEAWPLWLQGAWLLPVVFATSVAAMGLALLVASVARTEMQVTLYGALPVLVLALIGGCVLPRELMPEQTQYLSLFTPQGWALDAYRELLDPDPLSMPNTQIVVRACAVLVAFGLVFLGLAWALLKLED